MIQRYRSIFASSSWHFLHIDCKSGRRSICSNQANCLFHHHRAYRAHGGDRYDRNATLFLLSLDAGTETSGRPNRSFCAGYGFCLRQGNWKWSIGAARLNNYGRPHHKFHDTTGQPVGAGAVWAGVIERMKMKGGRLAALPYKNKREPDGDQQ
jgi:hypothetical protein